MQLNSLLIAAALGTTLASASMLSAQNTDARTGPEAKSRWEILVPGGTLVPTGAQRHALERGNLTALQVNYVAHPLLAVTSTVAWARSRDVALANEQKVDVFTYDVGAEIRAPQVTIANRATLRAFSGIGAGGRSYNYRDLDVDATHNVAGYASLGGEIGVRRVHVRLEARDYITGFKPLDGIGSARTSNDVVVMAAVRLELH